MFGEAQVVQSPVFGQKPRAVRIPLPHVNIVIGNLLAIAPVSRNVVPFLHKQ